MATRSIVTSQPDVECDVCERRLLRGEQPDVFLAAGRRHLVCELCAPRAVQGGWLRESLRQTETAPVARPRRRRGLLERLPAPFRARLPASASNGARETQDAHSPYDGEEAPYESLDGHVEAPGAAAVAHHPEGGAPGGDLEDAWAADASAMPDGHALAPHDHGFSPPPAVAESSLPLQSALAAFNAGEHPRRVAGVARALGAPQVSVRTSEHARSVVTIVIAWELCWYRYEVDLDEAAPVARAAARGTELGELTREECVANALAEESGTLLLSDAGAAGR
jgi:hypothetical protein